MAKKLFRVNTAFAIYDQDDETNPCVPAKGQKMVFDVGDIISCDVQPGGVITMNYDCATLFDGNCGMFGGCQSVQLNKANLTPVSKNCYSNYEDGDEECINPNTPVIDNKSSFLKRPFGMPPLVGYGIMAVGATGLTLLIVKLVKKKK